MAAGTGLFTAYNFASEEPSFSEEDPPPSFSPSSPPSSPLNYLRRPGMSTLVSPADILPACGLLWGNGFMTLGFSIYRYFAIQKALQVGGEEGGRGELGIFFSL